jgi:hypothetical protein
MDSQLFQAGETCLRSLPASEPSSDPDGLFSDLRGFPNWHKNKVIVAERLVILLQDFR